MYHHSMTTKYTTTFEYIIKASDILKGSTLNMSEASKNELSSYVPWVDYTRSTDLLGVAFDNAVVNVFNKNGDGIDTAGAIKMRPTLSHKPINLEHDRSTIVGHILDGSFTEIEFSKYINEKDLTLEDGSYTLSPFHITLGGILYKIAIKELTQILLDIQNGKQTDFVIASSWEVGFDKFYAAVGSNRLDQCRIIKDEAEIEKLAPYMRCFGGKGFTQDGEPVNRLISADGEILFLGAGLTKYPAANVGQVYVFDYTQVIEEKIPTSISHLNKDGVISNRTEQNMNKEEISTLIKEALASVASSGNLQESLAGATSTIADAIVESNKVFVAQKEEAEKKEKEALEQVKAQEERIASLEQKAAQTEEAFKASQEKLQKFEDEAKAALAKELFDSRMASLDSKFKLEDADRQILASKVSAIVSDEDFADFEKSLEVLMSAKLISKITEAEAIASQNLEKAIEEELKKRGVTNPLEGKETEEAGIPNNSITASEKELSVREKFSKAFDKKQIKVTL